MNEVLLDKLSKSKFRSRFKLSAKDLGYIYKKGFDVIEAHARDFIRDRIAPEVIYNDGKQTPFKNHPVFVAQNATATCCRSCISKWHGIPKGTLMTQEQQDKLVSIIMHWIIKQCRQKVLL